jgi:type I restriction enzyme S subunit
MRTGNLFSAYYADQSNYRRMMLAQIEKRFPGDHPRTAAVRQYLLNAFTSFVNSGLADPKFVTELASSSDQKFWACLSEALIADRLRGKSFGARQAQGQGPDFLVMDSARKVWIEVICPEPVDVPEGWLNPQQGQAVSFPHEQILLRWTSAIKAKAEVLIGSADGDRKGYLKSGVVAPDDAYVIAVNGCRLRSGPFPSLIGISQFPFAAEAVFPIGPYELRIDRATLQVVDRGYQHRPYVLNKNNAKVPAFTFLDPRFDAISAVWAVDLNGGSAIGNREPSAVVHNPNAINPVPLGFLPADDEYVAVPEGDGYILSKACVRSANDG